MNNTIRFSKPISAIALLLSLLCTSCDKKEDGKVTVMTKPITEITTTSAKSGGNVTATGNFSVGVCGVCWSENPSPTTNELFTTDNQGLGEYASSLRNLSPNTKYYLRAYATTSSGIIYGDELDFTTEALPVVTVTVYTHDVSEITASSAKCGGVVTVNGDVSITARGVCWSTLQNPTINDPHTVDGQGLGAFTSILSGLTASTPYFIRAYAITSDGNTTYGDSKTFTTFSGGGGGGEVSVTVYTNEVTEITESSAKCGGIVTANGDATITARGIYWSISQDFTLNVSHTSDGQGLGSFTSNLTGLTANTLYYVKAYATTSDGNTVYSNEIKSFSTSGTPGPGTELPTVEIGDITDITATSAKCNGNVTSDGGATVTERGLCWSTSSSPMIYHSHVACGSGTGGFIGDLTGLTSGTTYYVRAYATNSEGTNYSSEEKTFTTPTLPTVTTSSVTNITQTTATVGGNVTNDGGAAITSRGLCWSTSPNPTVETGSSVTCGSGTGSFTEQITGLTANTTYHIRAYATNVVDTNYGNDVTFTTEQSSVSLSDFLGVYSVSAFNRDTQQNETWTGTNIATFNNSSTNTTWIKVEGLIEGSGYEFYTALGEYSEEHHAIRLYGGWGFSSSSYHFYFTDEPDVWYYARFYPIYQTTGTTWYYLEHGSGYGNSGEAWLTMNPDGTLSLGPSEYPDENGRFANGFVFDYFKVEDNTKAGRFYRYTDVMLTKTSKIPMNSNEESNEVSNVKHDEKYSKRQFDNKRNENPKSINTVNHKKY